MTEAEIAATADDYMLDDRLWLRYVTLAAGTTAADVAALPEGVRAYFATRLFEWEVMNGGLHQFFFNNPDPAMLDLALEGYEYLGLGDVAALIREIVAPIAAREAEWRESLRDGRIETFMESYVESELPDFDERIEVHDAERLSFVRANPSTFAV